MERAEVLAREHPPGAVVRNREDHAIRLDLLAAEKGEPRHAARFDAYAQRGRPVPDLPSKSRENPLESMEKIREATPGERQPARARRNLEDPVEHASKETRGSLLWSFVEGRERQRPEHGRQVLAPADLPKPALDREARAVSVLREQRANAAGKVERPEPRAGTQPVTGSDRRDPVEWGGKIRTAESKASSSALPEAQMKGGIGLEGVFGAEAAQEPDRLRVEGGQDVLSVVLQVPGRGVDPARGASTRALPRLEHEHPRAALRERGRRGDAGEAGPDHDRVEGTAHRAACAARMELPAIHARSWNGTRTSREKTS